MVWRLDIVSDQKQLFLYQVQLDITWDKFIFSGATKSISVAVAEFFGQHQSNVFKVCGHLPRATSARSPCCQSRYQTPSTRSHRTVSSESNNFVPQLVNVLEKVALAFFFQEIQSSIVCMVVHVNLSMCLMLPLDSDKHVTKTLRFTMLEWFIECDKIIRCRP